MPVFLLKYWKYIVGIGLSIFLMYSIFLYGKITERRKWEVESLKEVIERKEEEAKVIDEGYRVIDKFKESKSTPMTLEKVNYYECLLSDNPSGC